jgi:transposase
MTQPQTVPIDVAKHTALKQSGALHPRPKDVRDEQFQDSVFFDPNDLVQVKYEMLRRVQVDGLPIAHAADRFGFSRPAFYQAWAAFQRDGLPGLIRKRTGPRRAHKMSDKVLQYLDALRAEDESLSLEAMAAKVRRKFRLTVHPRSIERALQRRQKKGR